MAKKVTTIKYQANDGTMFDTMAQAKDHDIQQELKTGFENEIREDLNALLIKLQKVESYERYDVVESDEDIVLSRAAKTLIEKLLNGEKYELRQLLNLEDYYNSNC